MNSIIIVITIASPKKDDRLLFLSPRPLNKNLYTKRRSPAETMAWTWEHNNLISVHRFSRTLDRELALMGRCWKSCKVAKHQLLSVVAALQVQVRAGGHRHLINREEARIGSEEWSRRNRPIRFNFGPPEKTGESRRSPAKNCSLNC